eukprot:2814251-Prymnesium_polylepis.1
MAHARMESGGRDGRRDRRRGREGDGERVEHDRVEGAARPTHRALERDRDRARDVGGRAERVGGRVLEDRARARLAQGEALFRRWWAIFGRWASGVTSSVVP